MAVSYASDIYTKDRLFFLKLLFRWTGSVWQLLWVDYLVFVLAYVGLALLYHEGLASHEHRQITFESVVRWLSKIRTSVPLSFMLGFFVSTVLGRWWTTVMSIPWLSSPSFYCQALICGGGEGGSDVARRIRVTILRYYNLAWILMMATVSGHIIDRFGFVKPKKSKQFQMTWRQRLDLINQDEKVRKRFGQLVTQEEIETFGRSAELSNNDEFTYSLEYWLPLVWATRLLRRAKTIGLIADERQLLFLVEMTQKFRGDLGTVWSLSEFNVPLVYTQVAVAGVYLFLFSTLLSTQLVKDDVVKQKDVMMPAVANATGPPPTTSLGVDILAYIPVLGSLEFIFYLGWFKIGICLLNPLGRDKADLPLSEVLNSNLKSSVKLGGAEDSLFPPGLSDPTQPDEQQVATLLRCFDFGGVSAHDEFSSADAVDALLHRQLLKRLQGTGRDLVQTLDVFQLTRRLSPHSQPPEHRPEHQHRHQHQPEHHQPEQKPRPRPGDSGRSDSMPLLSLPSYVKRSPADV